MDKQIGFIESNEQQLAEKLEYLKLLYNQEVTDDKIDDFVRNRLFQLYPTIEKIVIPVRLGEEDVDYTGLRFGLHIRLTKELGDKRFIPIVFVSAETRGEIISNQIENGKEKTGTLLFTPGVKLVSPFKIKTTVENFNEVITEDDFKRRVLQKLIVTNQRELGHQLANEWGVFRLAKFAGINLKSIQLPSDLYFKFQFAKSELNITPDNKSRIGLEKGSCRALLIDDQAERGWKDVLIHILKSHINQYSSTLDILTTYEDADNYANYENHDLVFLDLRLKPEEDQVSKIQHIEDLSGFKILRKIKAINRGIQVIILTASNKAWNMRKMLDEGADGYFIKESPDVAVSDRVSKENYDDLIETIVKVFDRKFLRRIYTEIDQVKKQLLSKTKGDNRTLDRKFVEQICKYLDLGFLSFSTGEGQYPIDSSFMYFFLILELVSKEFIDEDNPEQLESGEFVHSFRRTNSKFSRRTLFIGEKKEKVV
jgi:CheY-like chemotaxis protein